MKNENVRKQACFFYLSIYNQTPDSTTDCPLVSLHSAMFGMDPGAVPEPAEYSSPPSPRSNAGMGEEEVINLEALIVIAQSENYCFKETNKCINDLE